MCGVGRLLARPRIGAQFNVRSGGSFMSEDAPKGKVALGPDS